MDESWIDNFELPPPGNMMMSGPRAHEVFAKQGLAIAKVIRAAAEEIKGRPFGELKVLDLACGVGRVALPLYYYTKQPSVCVDVSAPAIEYLKSQMPEADVRTVNPEPPLPFADGSFDVVISVSLWTHLRPAMIVPYLEDTRRILKNDGVALITTAGYSAMASWKDLQLWDKSITPEDLRKRGEIFYPTPSGEVGNTAHSPEHIQKHWSRVFPSIETREGVIGLHKVQDLNIMRKA